MRRITIASSIFWLAVIAVSITPVIEAQNNMSRRSAAQEYSKQYSPRLIGRSNSAVIEGRITNIQSNRISVKSSRGSRYDFKIEDQTTVFDSPELVSIATMSDIALSVSDLRVMDLVEIVTEGAGRSQTARIITRISASGATVASRSGNR